jgi:hypothetical protein
MPLIDLDMAREHLRGAVSDPTVDDLTLKMAQAEAIVVTYIKRQDHTWTIESTDDPDFLIIQAVILKVLGNLFLFRGDDEESKGPLTKDLEWTLQMFRKPTLS